MNSINKYNTFHYHYFTNNKSNNSTNSSSNSNINSNYPSLNHHNHHQLQQEQHLYHTQTTTTSITPTLNPRIQSTIEKHKQNSLNSFEHPQQQQNQTKYLTVNLISSCNNNNNNNINSSCTNSNSNLKLASSVNEPTNSALTVQSNFSPRSPSLSTSRPTKNNYIKKFIEKYEQSSVINNNNYKNNNNSNNNCSTSQIHLSINNSNIVTDVNNPVETTKPATKNTVKLKLDKNILNSSKSTNSESNFSSSSSYSSCGGGSGGCGIGVASGGTAEFHNAILSNDSTMLSKSDIMAQSSPPDAFQTYSIPNSSNSTRPPPSPHHTAAPPTIHLNHPYNTKSTGFVLVSPEKLEELFIKYSSVNNRKKDVEEQHMVTPSHLNTLSDQVASYIEELKDFIDERLIDTACQLEMANQRTSDLHMTINYLISEMSCLKYQNQELKNGLNSFLIIKSSNKVEDEEKSRRKCSKCRSKSRKNKKSSSKTKSSDLNPNNNHSSVTSATTTSPTTATATSAEENNNKKSKSSNNKKSEKNNKSSSSSKNKKNIESGSCSNNSNYTSETCIDTVKRVNSNYSPNSIITCSAIDDEEFTAMNNHLHLNPNLNEKNFIRNSLTLLRNHTSKTSNFNLSYLHI
jgi:hypothetical protein